MTVRELIKNLLDKDLDAQVYTNVWLDKGTTVEGKVGAIVEVGAGIALKGYEVE